MSQLTTAHVMVHIDSIAPCRCKHPTVVSSPLLIQDNIVCLLRPCRPWPLSLERSFRCDQLSYNAILRFLLPVFACCCTHPQQVHVRSSSICLPAALQAAIPGATDPSKFAKEQLRDSNVSNTAANNSRRVGTLATVYYASKHQEQQAYHCRKPAGKCSSSMKVHQEPSELGQQPMTGSGISPSLLPQPYLPDSKLRAMLTQSNCSAEQGQLLRAPAQLLVSSLQQTSITQRKNTVFCFPSFGPRSFRKFGAVVSPIFIPCTDGCHSTVLTYTWHQRCMAGQALAGQAHACTCSHLLDSTQHATALQASAYRMAVSAT